MSNYININWTEVPAGTVMSVKKVTYPKSEPAYEVYPFIRYENGFVYVTQDGGEVGYFEQDVRFKRHKDFMTYKTDNIPEVREVNTNFFNIACEVAGLVDKKNADYGNSFEKQFERFGWTGYLIRISDKMERLENLTIKGNKSQVKESLKDTLQDIIGYTILMLDLLEKE